MVEREREREREREGERERERKREKGQILNIPFTSLPELSATPGSTIGLQHINLRGTAKIKQAQERDLKLRCLSSVPACHFHSLLYCLSSLAVQR
jgi:hypothetical protein